eukprot:CCRYP_012244-RB/>CCRYP_012244-RB protein AED:0.68 eAED:0.66 QI:0/-1/0/1/-1/0/1/0/157
MAKCRQILRDLQGKDVYSIFAIPVDPEALGIPTYFDIIKNPMDLGTIYSRLENGELDSPEEFIRLVRLVFENAVTFNTMPHSFVASTARSLLAFFNSKIRTVECVLDVSHKNKKLTNRNKAQREGCHERFHSTRAGGKSMQVHGTALRQCPHLASGQ